MSSRQECKSAKDVAGRRVVVGDFVQAVDDVCNVIGEPVRVVKIHRQGYDGTILTTDYPLEPDYPHHVSRAASRCVLVAMTSAERELYTLRNRIAMLEVCAQPFVEFIDKFDRKPLGGIDDEFYAIHAGEDGASLRLSDLRRLRAAIKS